MGSKISDERDQKLLSSQAVSPWSHGREVSWMTCVLDDLRQDTANPSDAVKRRLIYALDGHMPLPKRRLIYVWHMLSAAVGDRARQRLADLSAGRFRVHPANVHALVSSPRRIKAGALRDLSGFSGPGCFRRTGRDARWTVAQPLHLKIRPTSTARAEKVNSRTAKCRTRD